MEGAKERTNPAVGQKKNGLVILKMKKNDDEGSLKHQKSTKRKILNPRFVSWPWKA